MNEPLPPRRKLWRSLEQRADTPAFRRFLEREFPSVTDLGVGPERRRFLRLMAASLALAGLSACDDEEDGRTQEVPYVKNPEKSVPGSVLRYASSTLLDGVANGVLVTTKDGRPLKIEGNPQHPWSRGGTDIFMQASVLDLYDPARSQTVQRLDETSDWQAFRGAMLGRIAVFRAQNGAGLRLLTRPVTSPSLLAQIADMRRAFPEMHWHSHAGVGCAAAYEGSRRAFGMPLETRWNFEQARVLVSLDGDFLDPGPAQVGVARDWAAARAAAAASGALPALHAVASVPNLTSAKADFPLGATPSEILAMARGLLAQLSGVPAPQPALAADPARDRWFASVAIALHDHRGSSLVLAGSAAPPELQEVVHRINATLSNVGQTVFYTAPVTAEAESIADLAAAMHAGQVSALVMLDSNPVYDAPGDLRFADALQHVGLKIHAGLYQDETALRCDWHLPLTHSLEAWGDARAADGTVSLMQPTIAPLYDGRSPAEIVSLLADQMPSDGQTLLRRFWQGTQDADAFAPRWQGMLRDGFIADTAFEAQPVQPVAPASTTPEAAPGLDVVFRPDATLWDGRSANNGWLQELPKPLTKLVWDNVISIAPALAAREKLQTGDVVRVVLGDRGVEGPVWVLPGQADGVLGLSLGYGRAVPDVMPDAGYDAFALRAAADPWQVRGAALHKTDRRKTLATTQDHNTMEGQDFVRVQPVGAPGYADQSWSLPSLYPPPREAKDDTAWGMVIDLDACIGCNACVVACQAENNIAVVGPEQVAQGREMHWLRVDRYYDGPPETPVTHFQPVPCMHCEQAPCEVGCPVEATLHDSEGLNVMVYNRCVGTRACSGYCPYKVRHFNYFDYSAGAAPSLQLQRNPEVTVRARGVMEKCTYCVQRIEAARIDADKQNRPIADGTVQTACQSACPAQAIAFGNLNQNGSLVAEARKSPRNYALLGELNTRPRTSYLAVRAPRETGETG